MSESPTFNPEQEKVSFEQQKAQIIRELSLLEMQCDPNFSTLPICLNLAPNTPLSSETIKAARAQLLKRFAPDFIDATYKDPRLTEQANLAVAKLNNWVTEALSSLNSSSTSSTPFSPENSRSVEEQNQQQLNRSKNLVELCQIIDQIGGLTWKGKVKSGKEIYDLFTSLNYFSSPLENILPLFPESIQDKLSEFFYQKQIEKATNWQEFATVISKISQFKIMGQIYSSQEILQRFAQPNFQLDPILGYYSLRLTYNKIRSTQHEHFKKQTYQTVSGKIQDEPPKWW